MRAEERRRILGDEVIAQIHVRVKEAPEPSYEAVEELRRILAPTVRLHCEAARRRPAPDS
jgi:hypothetical protein